MIGKEEAEGIEDEIGRGTSGIGGGSGGERTTSISNDEARAEGIREVMRSKGNEESQEEGTSVGSEMEGDEEGNQ